MIITKYETGWTREINKTTTESKIVYKIGAHAPSLLELKVTAQVAVKWDVEPGGVMPKGAFAEHKGIAEECQRGRKYLVGPGTVRLRITADNKDQRWTYWEITKLCE